MKTSEKFEPGQVWKYAGRPGEEESTLTILKIEQYEKGGTIIHIRVDGIILFNPNTGRDNLTHIGHMPFAGGSHFAVSNGDRWAKRQPSRFFPGI